MLVLFLKISHNPFSLSETDFERNVSMGNVERALRAEVIISNMKPTELAVKHKQEKSICSSLTLNRTEIKSLERNTTDILLNEEKFVTPDFVENSPNFKTYIDSQFEKNPEQFTEFVNDIDSCSSTSELGEPETLDSSATRPGTAITNLVGVTKNEHIEQRALANSFLSEEKYINKESLTKKEFLLLDEVLVDRDDSTTEKMQESLVEQKFQAERDKFIEKEATSMKNKPLDSVSENVRHEEIILSPELSEETLKISNEIVDLSFSASFIESLEHEVSSDLVQEEKAYNSYIKKIYFLEGEEIMRNFQVKVYSVFQGLHGFRRRFVNKLNKFYNREMRIYQGDDDLNNIITDLESAYSSELNKVTKLKNAEIRFQEEIGIIHNTYSRILEQIDDEIEELRINMKAKFLLNDIYSRCDLWENSKELIEKEEYEEQIINELAQLSELNISELEHTIDELTSEEELYVFKANTHQTFKQLLKEVKYEYDMKNEVNTALVGHNEVNFLIEEKLLDESFIIRDQELLHYSLTLDYNRMVPEQFNLPLLLKDSIIAVNKTINSDIIWLLSERLITFKHPYFEEIYEKVDAESVLELQKEEERRKRVIAMFAKLHQKGKLTYIVPKSMKTMSDNTIMEQELILKINNILQPKYNYSMLSLSPIDKLLIYIECRPFVTLRLNFSPLFTVSELTEISKSIHPIIKESIIILNESRIKPIILFESPQHCVNAIRDASYETAKNFVTREFENKPTCFIQSDELKKWRLTHAALKEEVKQLTIEVNDLNGLYEELEYEAGESNFSQLVWKEALTKEGLYKEQNEIDFTKTINLATSNLAYDTDRFDSLSMLQTEILTDKLEILNESMNSLFQQNPVFMQTQETGIDFSIDMMLNICNAKINTYVEEFENFSKEERERARIILRRREYFRTVNSHKDIFESDGSAVVKEDEVETMEQYITRETHVSEVKLNYPTFEEKRPTILNQLVRDELNKRINSTTEEKGFYD